MLCIPLPARWTSSRLSSVGTSGRSDVWACAAPLVRSPQRPHMSTIAHELGLRCSNCSPDGTVRYIWTRTGMEPGTYGLPVPVEAGLPSGELFDIIPIPGTSTAADMLIEIKVIAAGIGKLLHPSLCRCPRQIIRLHKATHVWIMTATLHKS